MTAERNNQQSVRITIEVTPDLHQKLKTRAENDKTSLWKTVLSILGEDFSPNSPRYLLLRHLLNALDPGSEEIKISKDRLLTVITWHSGTRQQQCRVALVKRSNCGFEAYYEPPDLYPRDEFGKPQIPPSLKNAAVS